MTHPQLATVRGLPVPSDVRTVEIEGATVAYRESGTGEPVVFVHGSISDLTTWDAQIPAIGSGYRAIAYSRRYAWPNDDLPTGEPDLIGRHVTDLLAFLRAVDARPAHVVGNSFGAVVALTAAIREPSAVRSLVLEEPALAALVVGAPPTPRRILRSLVRRPLLTLSMLRFGATTLLPATRLAHRLDVDQSIAAFARGVLGNQEYAALPEKIRRHMTANSGTHLGQLLAGGGFEPISEAEIRSVTTPALLVRGARSPGNFRRLAHLTASLLPDAREVDIPDASHGMHFENPSAVNTAILSFLTDLP